MSSLKTATFMRACKADLAAGNFMRKFRDTGEARYIQHAITMLGRAQRRYKAAGYMASADDCAKVIADLDRIACGWQRTADVYGEQS